MTFFYNFEIINLLIVLMERVKEHLSENTAVYGHFASCNVCNKNTKNSVKWFKNCKTISLKYLIMNLEKLKMSFVWIDIWNKNDPYPNGILLSNVYIVYKNIFIFCLNLF